MGLQERGTLTLGHRLAELDRVLLDPAALSAPVVGTGRDPVVFNPLPAGELVVAQASEVNRILPPPLPVHRHSGAAYRLSVALANMRQSLHQHEDTVTSLLRRVPIVRFACGVWQVLFSRPSGESWQIQYSK